MKFRKHFKTNGYCVNARIVRRGKRALSYEIRYRHLKDGYNISASGKTLEKAKERFIERVNEIEREVKISVPKNFKKFALYYFENFKKRKVVPITYKNDLRRLEKHLFPAFGNYMLKEISAIQIQNFLDSFIKKGHGKTAEELRSLLNQIFKIAINHGIITLNPVGMTFQKKHERKHGSALSLEEEQTLLTTTAGTPYQLMFAVALYTGLRPNEYKTAKIEGQFIIALNSKRHGGKVEYKKIPISPMLAPHLKGVQELYFYTPKAIRVKFNEILPNHILYDLRTTFYTRCRICGVSDAARDEFVGHSAGKLSDTYTDLPDDYLLSEGKKIKY